MHEALGRFYDRAPKVILNIETASPQQLQQRLLDGRYFLIMTPIQAPHAHIHATPVFEETQTLYCGLSHSLFDMAARKIKPAALRDFAYAARNYMVNWTGPANIAFRTAAMTAHMKSLAMLILSGRYIGYLPVHYAENWVKSGQMRAILPDEMSYMDTFYLAHLASEKNRAMSTLLDCVRSHIASNPMPQY